MTELYRVLLVDDDESFLGCTAKELEERGCDVVVATSGPGALSKAHAQDGNFHVAVIDQAMGPPNGTEIMQQLHRKYPSIEVILLTGWGDLKPGVKAIELGAYRYMSKTGNADELVLNIEAAARLGRERQRALALQALVDAGQAISGARSEEELCQRLHQQCKQLLPGLDSFLVSLWDEPSSAASFPYRCIRGKIDSNGPRVGRNGITEYVIRIRKPLLLPMGDESLRREHGLDEPQIGGYGKSQIIAPMFLDGRILGTLTAITIQDGVRYTQEHLEVLQAFANQAAAAVQNLRRLREAEQLRDAVAALAKQSNLDEVFRTIVEEAHRLIESDLTGLILQHPCGTLQKVRPTIPEDFFDKFDHPRQDDGVTRWVVEQRQPRKIPDTHADELVKESVREVGIRSMLAMPLIYGDRVWGTLYAHAFRPRTFNEHDVGLWSSFAAQAAAAIWNVRRQEESRIWQEMNRKINMCIRPGDLHRLFANCALEVFRADFAVFYPYDPTTTPSTLREEDAVAVGDLQADLEPPKGGLGGGVHWAIEQDRNGLLVVNDLDAEEGCFHSRLTKREGVKAFIGLRLDVIPEGQVEPKLAGMLFVNFRRPTAFEPADLSGLLDSARHVAAAILRLRLLELVQVQRERLSKQMGAVVEILEGFRSRRDRAALLATIAEQVHEVHQVPVCSVLEWDAAEKVFSVRGVAGQSSDTPSSLGDTGRYKEFLEEGDCIVVRDARRHRLLKNSRFVKSEKIRTVMIYPLRVGGEPVGLLFANYRHKGEIALHAQEEISLFAQLSAIVIHEARLREELSKTQKRLERRTFLDWVSMIEASWRHEVVGKAVSVLNRVEFVRRRLEECEAPVPVHDEIRVAVDHMGRMATDIANAPPRVPQSWEMRAERFPLASLLVEVAARESGPLAGSPPLTIVTDVDRLGDAQVEGYRRWFIYAIECLLGNARNAMPNGGAAYLTGTYREGWAEICVRDEGPGIPPSIRDRIFDEPVPKENDPEGRGLGCVLAATIMEEHGGAVAIEDTGPKGTTVVMRVPVVGGAG